MTTAAPIVAHVSARARSAPFQYGPEVSASQNVWLSKLASTRPSTRPPAYFTSPAGMLYLAASFPSVPFAFSALIAAAIFPPIASPRR
jgi:hypothetical protein